ncbi:MAG: hypothetical protein CL967_03790 [Euryarchaeota archaeon]|nr:hypothetical protein [Euryarchaeota archaeon]
MVRMRVVSLFHRVQEKMMLGKQIGNQLYTGRLLQALDVLHKMPVRGARGVYTRDGRNQTVFAVCKHYARAPTRAFIPGHTKNHSCVGTTGNHLTPSLASDFFHQW